MSLQRVQGRALSAGPGLRCWSGLCSADTTPLRSPRKSQQHLGPWQLRTESSRLPSTNLPPGSPTPQATCRFQAPAWSLGSWLGGGRDPTSFSLGQPRLPHHPPAALRACVLAPCVVGGWEGKGPCPCPRPPGVRGRAVDACVNARGAEGLREPRFPWLLESTHLAQAASTLLSGDRWWGAVWG